MLKWIQRWLGLERRDPAEVPAEQWDRVERTLPFLDFLTPPERTRLRALALEFLACKQFHGARGLHLNDDILLSIALQACLLVLDIGLEAYAGWVGIVVYPGDFVIPRREFDEAGVVHEYEDEVLGEAWEGGPVLVAWFDEGAHPPGVNVVIHEFAHKLDMENGGVDGLPRLRAGMSRSAWAAAFGEAFDAFCAEVERGVETVIDPYAAEDPGEFFAVVSETFFECPAPLRDRFPAVYKQLRLFYGLDPAAATRYPHGDRA
ncbi:zinc-dependent peptidase [Thauera chlorobenzoica]|uniref:Membrane protein n=1 Tax=Thauera chlorobenzoica TaxID=96773 RepID=A0A1H5YQZ2_9RHOO|nr:M90 family metallopeptidase [Thauera chlorobenzoica]APR05486.1 membrane protein [Thauera chlorobenzoica]SEG26511.1 hypothetical protein SAMN05216242_13312 [Thauera chlorobenzoica]